MSDWIAGEAIAEAVNAANLFRKIYGESLIDDLPKSTAGEPEQCVLAKAFNFDCQVNGSIDGTWYVEFPINEVEKAAQLATILGTETWRVDYGHEKCNEEEACYIRVELPKKIAMIATEFDSGRLDGKYYTVDPSGFPYGVPTNSPAWQEAHEEAVAGGLYEEDEEDEEDIPF